MPAGDGLKRYTVLEGNRRLVAIRALENPDSFHEAINTGTLNVLRKISHEYQKSPIDSISCLVVKSRENAQHWISLRHTGENDGAGIVKWGGDETARFRARSGSNRGLHLQALDFLESQGQLSPEERHKVPSTSLNRLLGTPGVREKLGIDVQKGELLAVSSNAKVAKALKFVTDDLASGNTKVADIYTKKQRIKYACNLPKEVIVKRTLDKGREISEEVNSDSAKKRAATKGDVQSQEII